MSIFVDTSGILAVMSVDDRFHPAGAAMWRQWVDERPQMITSNYVLVETVALLQRRAGMGAVRSFHRDILPVIQVEWITARIHQTAVTALLAAGQRDLSLVDCASFEVMRHLGLCTVFAFDRHFAEHGFTCLP